MELLDVIGSWRLPLAPIRDSMNDDFRQSGTRRPVVPLNRPTVAQRQAEYVIESMGSSHLAGDGPYTRRVAGILEELHGGAPVLLTPSCTAALELSAMLLDLGPNDEVIVPSFTFVTSASAFALLGARLVFADIDPATFNIDLDQVPDMITERTRAVVVVHYGGVGVDPKQLEQLRAQHPTVTIVEDNAHGLLGARASLDLGTAGHLSSLSFHETKNFTCGEGGALVINEPSLVERAEILREKGTDRSKFFRGMVDKYTWVDLGSSYLLADVNAAMLLAQLEDRDTIQSRREAAWLGYRNELATWAHTNDVEFQAVPADARHPSHLFAMLLPDPETRQRFFTHLRERGVVAAFHYLPLHDSRMGRELGWAPNGCPVSVSVASRLARLPVFSDIADNEIETVIDAVQSFAS